MFKGKMKWWVLALLVVGGAYFSSTIMGVLQKAPVIGDWFKPKPNQPTGTPTKGANE